MKKPVQVIPLQDLIGPPPLWWRLWCQLQLWTGRSRRRGEDAIYGWFTAKPALAWGIVLILLQTLIAGAQVLISTALDAQWQQIVFYLISFPVTMIIPLVHFCLALEWRPKYPLFIGYYLALPVLTYLILL
jgi:hypothetical protein